MSMQINITGDNLKLTTSLEKHVTKKLNEIEHKFPHITNVHVILSIENNFQHKAEATIHLAGSKGVEVFANFSSKDMYVSINALMRKLNTQVLEHKNRMQKHHKNSHP